MTFVYCSQCYVPCYVPCSRIFSRGKCLAFEIWRNVSAWKVMYVGHAQGTLWWFVITAVVENLAPLVMPPFKANTSGQG